MRRSKSLLAILALALCSLGIGVADAVADPPQVSAVSVSNVSYTSAHVTGQVGPHGLFTPWSWEVSSDGGASWEGKAFGLAQGNDPVDVSTDLEGLVAGVTYQVRLSASNAESPTPAYSPEPNPEFTTLPLDLPTVEIGPVSAPTATTAVFSGHVKANSPPDKPSAADAHWHFECTPECPGVEGTVSAGAEEDIEVEATGLSPNTEYEVTLVAGNAAGNASDGPVTFKTSELPPPTVEIDPVTTFTGTTARFSGSINPNAPGGGNPSASEVNWNFQCTPECPNVSIDSSPTPNPVPGDAATHVVSGEATGLEPNTTYEVTLVGKNAGEPVTAGPVSFKTEAAAPLVLTIPAFVLEGGTSALVGGRVNPRNSGTSWWIEYGTTETYGQSLPASKDAVAGSGAQFNFLTQALSGLSLGTTYHFRVTAKNATGEVHGEDRTFTTPTPAEASGSCPNAAFRTGASANLPDCRAYESVNPLNLQGTRTFVPTVAENGEAALWETGAILPDVDSTGVRDTYLAKRTSNGWTSTIVSPPAAMTRAFYGAGGSGPATWTPNLDGSFIWAFGNAVNPEDPDPTGAPGVLFEDIFRRELDGSFVWLNRGSAVAPIEGVDSLDYIGASSDQKTVYFSDARQYEPDAPDGGFYIRSGNTTTVIKDENGNTLPLINLDNEGPLLSADGSTLAIINFNENTQRDQLYIYRPSVGHAVLVTTGPVASIQLISVSADGSKLIFATPEQLAPGDDDSSSDFYEYDLSTGTFRRLTGTAAGPGPGNGNANPHRVHTYPGNATFSATKEYLASSDGSAVYFTSTEQLDASKGVAGEPNLYLADGGAIHYVVTLTGDLQKAELSDDGKTAMFASADRLTAYDNAGHTEVYAYNSSDGTTVCVSCRPDGEAAEADSELGGAQFATPRPVRNSDRHGDHIFFVSSDPLVPRDTNNKADVYEYNMSSGTVALISTGEGPDDSSFAGIGGDGRDVFFTSADSLLPNDQNVGTSKLFDARIGGGFPEAPPAPAVCEGEGCRGAGSAKPADVSPTTPSFVGPGNPKHKHKHKKHHKHHKRKHKRHKKHHAKSQKRDANRNGRTGR